MMHKVKFVDGKEINLSDMELGHIILMDQSKKRIEEVEITGGGLIAGIFVSPTEGLPLSFPFVLRWPWVHNRIKQIVSEEYKQ